MHGLVWGSDKWESPYGTFPAESDQGDTVFSFQLSGCKQVSFSWSTYCCDFFFFFFLVISLFKMTPKHSAEALSSVPECKEAVMGLTEKMHVT